MIWIIARFTTVDDWPAHQSFGIGNKGLETRDRPTLPCLAVGNSSTASVTRAARRITGGCALACQCTSAYDKLTNNGQNKPKEWEKGRASGHLTRAKPGSQQRHPCQRERQPPPGHDEVLVVLNLPLGEPADCIHDDDVENHRHTQQPLQRRVNFEFQRRASLKTDWLQQPGSVGAFGLPQ